MNDKDLLTEDVDGKLKEAAIDALPNETDSKQNNETDLTSGISSPKNEVSEAEAKPKRKYTRKATPTSIDKTQTETYGASKTEEDTVNPKRTYKKRSTSKKVDSQVSDTENTSETDSVTPKSTDAIEPTSDLFVEEEFKFIPDLSAPVFEENLHPEYVSDEAVTDEESQGEKDRILPPDELFADRSIENEAPAEDEAPSEIAAEKQHFDAPMHEDGQYRFKELDEPEDEPVFDAPKEPQPEGYDPKKPRRIDGRFDILELFVFTLLAVMIITSFLFRHSIVEGASMENTLHSGEHLIISDLFYTPKQGDIIVCEDYTTSISKPIVKRVIAVAGDTVEIKEDGSVYVNGKLLEENYVNIDNPYYRYKELTVKVPEGELFVMGDHRNESTDSREIGTVSEDSVLGKVLIRFYPFDKFGTVK